MSVSVLTDLPGRSVATTSTYTTKLEHFDRIGTHGESNFKNKFLAMVSQVFRRNNYLLTKLEHQIIRETTVRGSCATQFFLVVPLW